MNVYVPLSSRAAPLCLCSDGSNSTRRDLEKIRELYYEMVPIDRDTAPQPTSTFGPDVISAKWRARDPAGRVPVARCSACVGVVFVHHARTHPSRLATSCNL